MERRTALKKSYHTISTKGQTNSKRLAEFFSRDGQGLLPMVDLMDSRLAVDELIDIAGRATIEPVLQLSAEQVAGPGDAGEEAQGLLGHGRQAGRVRLKERKLGVTKPRLREKGGGEVAIPAYEAMQFNGTGQRMLDVLMRGMWTRQYTEVLPEMASSRGASKSTVSREVVEVGEEEVLEGVAGVCASAASHRPVIYLDGMQFGEHHVISASWVWIGPHTSTCWVCSRERQTPRRRRIY